MPEDICPRDLWFRLTQNQELPGWLRGAVPACNTGDSGSIPGSGRFPWRRKWQPTPAFLPGESHGQKSLAGCSPWGGKKFSSVSVQFSTVSVQFSGSVVSDSLRPHELQHARPPCPSPTAGVYPNLCPLSRWCHPTISSSVIQFRTKQQRESGSLSLNSEFQDLFFSSTSYMIIWTISNPVCWDLYASPLPHGVWSSYTIRNGSCVSWC